MRVPLLHPPNLLAASASGAVQLRWSPSSDDTTDVAEYLVYRKTTDQWIKLASVPAGSATYQDTQVQTGSAYSYLVAAVDRFANRSDSNQAGPVTVLADADTVAPVLPSPTHCQCVGKRGACCCPVALGCQCQ